MEVLVRTKVDREEQEEQEEMVDSMAVAEGVAHWEETSARTGHNVELTFSLCGLTAWLEGGRDHRVKRLSSLSLGVGCGEGGRRGG